MSEQESSAHQTRRQEILDSPLEAWTVLVNADQSSAKEVEYLIKRGYQYYNNKGSSSSDNSPLLKDAESFATYAIRERPSREEVLADPVVSVERPGKLAAIHGVASAMVERNPSLADDGRPIIATDHLDQLLSHHVMSALNRFSERTELLFNIGERLYSPPNKEQVPGRTVRAVRRLEDIGRETHYLEIPVAHGSKKTLVYTTSEEGGYSYGYEAESSSELKTIIRDNNLYVPVSDLYERVNGAFAGRRSRGSDLANSYESLLSKSQAEAIEKFATEKDGGLYDHLEKLMRGNWTEGLVKTRDVPLKIQVIVNAVAWEDDDDDIALGEWVTAEQIEQAVSGYRSSEAYDGYEREPLEKLGSSRGIASVLRENSDSDRIQKSSEYEGISDNPMQYRLHRSNSNWPDLTIEEIGDLEELPCVNNLVDWLMEGHVQREPLFTLVDIALWTDDTYFELDDFVDYFSKFPWFDEHTSRYQTEYQIKRHNKRSNVVEPQRGAAVEPQPMISCNHEADFWARFCVGKENCDYSLYSSLNLRDEVYEVLGGTEYD